MDHCAVSRRRSRRRWGSARLRGGHHRVTVTVVPIQHGMEWAALLLLVAAGVAGLRTDWYRLLMVRRSRPGADSRQSRHGPVVRAQRATRYRSSWRSGPVGLWSTTATTTSTTGACRSDLLEDGWRPRPAGFAHRSGHQVSPSRRTRGGSKVIVHVDPSTGTVSTGVH